MADMDLYNFYLISMLTTFLTLSFVILSVTLPAVATINFASCVLFPVLYLMMQLLPWSMLLLLIGSIIAARF